MTWWRDLSNFRVKVLCANHNNKKMLGENIGDITDKVFNNSLTKYTVVEEVTVILLLKS